jgi:hypothetical protein
MVLVMRHLNARPAREAQSGVLPMSYTIDTTKHSVRQGAREVKTLQATEDKSRNR